MLSRKARALKPSPTLAIAAKAKELAAQGHRVISLSVGEPDWDTSEEIKAAGWAAIQQGQTKYAPANGLPQLRGAIAQQTSQLIGVDYKASEVTVSAGAKFILFSAFQTLLDPGDEVLIPAPYWVSYPTMVELVDGLPVIVPSDASSGFKPTARQIEEKITAKTKLLLLNSPNNPTGAMYSREEISAIGDMLVRHPHVVVVSDDIYNQLVFTGVDVAPHLLHTHPQLKSRMVIVNGASKTYAMTGWRLGWALGPEPVIQAMSSYQSQTVSCAAPFTQMAGLAGLQGSVADLMANREKLRERRDLFVEALNQVPGWKAGLPDGAFYVWADVQALLGKVHKNRTLENTSMLAAALLEDQKVATVPGAESGLEGYLRLSFAVSEADLNEAIKRLREFTAALLSR
ncbi:MAG: pyridoxal phosphate-dependent aminotransferase [Bdellovibrionales bacterium]